MSNIKEAFKSGKVFIPFLTCGDPELETTGKIAAEMERNGADIIVLGIPFSDPVAEGTVIQNANIRALSGGVTTDKIFAFVCELRKTVKIPMVFMTYANVVYSYGVERFVAECAKAEIGGIILPDVPFEEKEEFEAVCRKYNVDVISVVAQTSGSRAARIAKEASGFIYAAASFGDRGEITADAEKLAKCVHENTEVPCVLNANILPEQAKKAAKHFDGIIADSAIVNIISEYGKNAAKPVGEYVKKMKKAIE